MRPARGHETGLPTRRSIRLRDFDYSRPGAYYVTICTHGRKPLLAELHLGALKPTGPGRIVMQCWVDLPLHFDRVSLDIYALLPDHLHGVLNLGERREMLAEGVHPRSGDLGTIIRSFKAATTREINIWGGTPGERVWQRGYHEHVIRDSRDLGRVQTYIGENPMSWIEECGG